MIRAATLAASVFALMGCAKPEQPIGYTPSSPAESTRSEAPPSGGGGYAFGADVGAVRAKCARDRGELAQSGRVTVCKTQHPELGATQLTLVELCGGVVCRVHSLMLLDRPDAEGWLVPFEVLRRQLQKSFGTPDEDHTDFPAECEQRFAECVRSGKAAATLRWRWDDGHAVMLRLGATDQVPAAISVSYEDRAP